MLAILSSFVNKYDEVGTITVLKKYDKLLSQNYRLINLLNTAFTRIITMKQKIIVFQDEQDVMQNS